ncbi:hypothetical protein [Marinobacterium aestuariivivens]|uniref:Uncharacterized protein n=1 Tax=Marinobacterium aestuariivivens TaxID=1698799 RepID=A0ABW1ZTF4_9GAMM
MPKSIPESPIMKLRKLFNLSISSFFIAGLFLESSLTCAEPLTSTASTEKSALSKLANEMKPGEWAELKTKRPDKLMHVFVGYRPSGKAAWYHIAGWTDDGKWDPKSRQFLFMGFRKQYKFIAYAEDSNAWRILPGPFGWNTPDSGTFKDTRKTKFGHVYGRNALDSEHGIFYVAISGYTYAYNLKSSTWTRTSGGSGMSIEYFPGLGLLSHDTDPQRGKTEFPLELLRPNKNNWESFTTLPFSGYHSISHYNPILDEMLFIAGNDNRSVVTLKRNGQLSRKKDLPFDMTIRYGQVVVDPNTGRYLIFNLGLLHEFNSQTNEYQPVNDYRPLGVNMRCRYLQQYPSWV